MININFSDAKQVATKMESAADSLKNAMEMTFTVAGQTTLEVNEMAQDANQKALHVTNVFHEAFQQTILDIQSVTIEFERTDNEISQSINHFTAIQDLAKDMQTYNRAKTGSR